MCDRNRHKTFVLGTVINKRWQNLRTCFARELKAQQSTKSGQAATKRRKYVYFERLLFLLPDTEQRPTESNLSPATDVSGDVEENEEEIGEEESVQVPRTVKKRKRKKIMRNSL